jgi:hypothetical protein
MSPCELLDDYLARDLAADSLARFVEHVPNCADCRRAVAEQERLDQILTDAVEHLEPVPTHLTRGIERRGLTIGRQRLVTAVAALAASIAFIWFAVRPTPLPIDRTTPPIAEPPAMAAVKVKFPSGEVIAVPETMDVPNVTFLWVHPTLARNSERSLP